MNIRNVKVTYIIFFILVVTLLLIVFPHFYWQNYTKQLGIEDHSRGEQNNSFTHRHKITLEGETFVGDLLDVLYRFREYHGLEIEVEGFVHRKEEHEEKQFTIARLLMTCCDEDTEVMGLLSHWDIEEEIPDNTWVRITGNLQSIQKYDEITKRQVTSPIIIVEKLEVIEEPEDPYIYP